MPKQFVLKAKVADEIRCLTLQQTDGQNITMDELRQAISEIWPDVSAYKAKYPDSEGDLCSLTSETIPHLLHSAIVSGDDTMLKLELQPERTKDEEAPHPSHRLLQPNMSHLMAPPQEQPPAVDPPSLLSAWVDIFWMGFNRDRKTILEVQGPKDLASKVKAEATGMSLIIALIWKDSMGLFLQLGHGNWDKVLNGEGDFGIAWYSYAGMVVASLACLTTALMCNILLVVILSNILEPNSQAFIEDAGWTMKIPYLGAVYGLLLYCGAQGVLAYFAAPSRAGSMFVLSFLGVGVIVVQYSCARFIRASYVANSQVPIRKSGTQPKSTAAGHTPLNPGEIVVAARGHD